MLHSLSATRLLAHDFSYDLWAPQGPKALVWKGKHHDSEETEFDAEGLLGLLRIIRRPCGEEWG